MARFALKMKQTDSMLRQKFDWLLLSLVIPLVILSFASFYELNRDRQTERLIQIVKAGDYYQVDTTGSGYNGHKVIASDEAHKVLMLGAEPNVKLNGEIPLVKIAVQRSNVKLVEVLQSAGAEIDAETSKFIEIWRSRARNENLCRAVEYGNIDKVDEALRGGADINGQGLQKSFPLQIAVANTQNVSPNMTFALLKRGANAHQKINRELTLIPLALRYHEDLEVITALEKAGALVTPSSALAIAVLRNDAQKVEKLLNAGAKVDGITSRGDWTPLQRAAFKGFDSIVELLLKRGADFRLTSSGKRFGYTALELAEERNSFSYNRKSFDRTIALLKRAEKSGMQHSLTISKRSTR